MLWYYICTGNGSGIFKERVRDLFDSSKLILVSSLILLDLLGSFSVNGRVEATSSMNRPIDSISCSCENRNVPKLINGGVQIRSGGVGKIFEN